MSDHMERIQFESIKIDGSSIVMLVKREHLDDSFLGNIGESFGKEYSITGEVELLDAETVKLKMSRANNRFWFAPKK